MVENWNPNNKLLLNKRKRKEKKKNKLENFSVLVVKFDAN